MATSASSATSSTAYSVPPRGQLTPGAIVPAVDGTDRYTANRRALTRIAYSVKVTAGMTPAEAAEAYGCGGLAAMVRGEAAAKAGPREPAPSPSVLDKLIFGSNGCGRIPSDLWLVPVGGPAIPVSGV